MVIYAPYTLYGASFHTNFQSQTQSTVQSKYEHSDNEIGSSQSERLIAQNHVIYP